MGHRHSLRVELSSGGERREKKEVEIISGEIICLQPIPVLHQSFNTIFFARSLDFGRICGRLKERFWRRVLKEDMATNYVKQEAITACLSKGERCAGRASLRRVESIAIQQSPFSSGLGVPGLPADD